MVLTHEFAGLLERESPTMFKFLEAGPFHISIQASETHYCIPRETLPDAREYAAFEVAIFEFGKWIQPLEDERFAALKEELAERWEPGKPPVVGGYVPADLVQRLYEHCKEMKEG